jgi:hypothetical protein
MALDSNTQALLSGFQIGNTWSAGQRENRKMASDEKTKKQRLEAHFGDDTVYDDNGEVDIVGSAAKQRLRDEAQRMSKATGTLNAFGQLVQPQVMPPDSLGRPAEVDVAIPDDQEPTPFERPMGQRLIAPPANVYEAEGAAAVADDVVRLRQSQEANQALKFYRDQQRVSSQRRLELAEEEAKRKAEADRLAAIPLSEKKTVPVVTPDGTVIGQGIPGAAGSFQLINPPKAELPATPAAATALIRAIDGEIEANDTSLTPERKANLLEQRKQAVDYIRSKVNPNYQPLTPVLSTNRFMGIGPARVTTNYVRGVQPPGAVVPPASIEPSGPPVKSVDDERSKAYRAIESGKDEAAVRATFKARTGKDLPWPPPK